MSEKILTNRIKEFREERKLTQEELGKLVDKDSTTVSKHENMERAVTPLDVKAYCRVFKVESYELFISPEALG